MIPISSTPALALALSAVSLGGACNTLAAEERVSTRNAPLECAVTARPARYGTTLTAEVTALLDVQGRYHLDIQQESDAGRTLLSQSGQFDLSAGQSETLGQVTLATPAGRQKTEFWLNWGGREFMCEGPGPSEI